MRKLLQTHVVGVAAQNVEHGNDFLFVQFFVEGVHESLELVLRQHADLLGVELSDQLVGGQLVFQHQSFNVAEETVLGVVETEFA